MKCLDDFLAKLRAGQIQDEHTVELTNEELADYNQRGVAGPDGGLFLLPPPRWCRLASDTLKAHEREDWSEERRQSEIDALWGYCFAEAAESWNRDYRPFLQAQLRNIRVAPITHGSFSIWLLWWRFE